MLRVARTAADATKEGAESGPFAMLQRERSCASVMDAPARTT